MRRGGQIVHSENIEEAARSAYFAGVRACVCVMSSICKDNDNTLMVTPLFLPWNNVVERNAVGVVTVWVGWGDVSLL